MAEKITIAELDINTDAFLKSATDTKAVLDGLKQSQSELKKTGQQSTEAFVKNEVAIKRLSTQYNEQKNVLVSLNSQNTDFIKTEKAINDAVNKNITTIAQARANNKELLKVRNQLNLSTKAGQKELIKINSKLDDNNKFIKENVSGYEKQKINIGNYEGALRKAFPAMGGFIDILKEAKTVMTAHKVATDATIASTKVAKNGFISVSGALKIFKYALISTGIGAIVVALGSLITFLSTTQEGIDAVTKVTKPLQVIFQSLLGVIQDLGKDLFDAFSKPEQLLKNLLTFLENQVVNRFKSFAVILDGIADFDTKKISNGLFQLSTGIEDVIGKTSKMVEKSGEFFDDAIDKGNELRQIGIDIEQKEAELGLKRVKLLDQMKAQELIAKNTALSSAERIKSADEALRLSKELAGEEKQLIDLKIKEEEITQSLNDSGRQDLKKLNELKAQAYVADTNQKKEELKFIGVRSQVTKEGIARDKKAKDDADKQAKKDAKEAVELTIDLADRELEIYKRTHQAKLDANTFYTEEMLLQEQKRLDDIAQKEKDHQALLLENKKISQVEYNQAVEDIDYENRIKKEEAELEREEAEKEKAIIDLENQRAIDDANYQTQFEADMARLEQDREAEKREAIKTGADLALINKKYDTYKLNIEKQKNDALLAMTADTLGGIANLLGENTKAGKAFAVAQALINTYQGITAELSTKAITPYEIGLKIANVALVAGTGFSAVKNIVSTPIPPTPPAKFYEGGQVPYGTGGKISGQNIPTQQGGDNILATVKSGEVILNEDQQRRAGGSAFFRSIGVPNFNTGGQIPSSVTSKTTGQAENNTAQFANILAQNINKIKVVAIVDEITGQQEVKAEIIDGANV